MRLDLVDEVRDDLALFGTHVNEEILFAEFVDEVEDFLRVALDGVEVGLAVDELEEFELAAVVVLAC